MKLDGPQVARCVTFEIPQIAPSMFAKLQAEKVPLSLWSHGFHLVTES